MGTISLFFLFERSTEKSATLLSGVLQIGEEKESLPSHYFLQCLDIDQTKEVDLSLCDLRAMEEKIRSAASMVRDVHLSTDGNYLVIRYQTRKAIYQLGDYRALFLDNEGYFFSKHPYFRPKRLPSLFLGPKGLVPKERKIDPQLHLCLKELEMYLTPYTVRSIDLSKSLHSWGPMQEVVIALVDLDRVVYLRLHPKRIAQGFKKYALLRHWIALPLSGAKPYVDLRLERSAFLFYDSSRYSLKEVLQEMRSCSFESLD